MTVIAVKDGIIAADTQSWHGNLKISQASKLRRMEIGICGFAGWRPVIERAIVWLEAGGPWQWGNKPPAIIADDATDLTGVILRPDGSIWNLTSKFDVYRTENVIDCCGAHPEFLYGAMLAGASAEEAVRLAIRYCEFAGGEVEVMRL